MSAGRLYAVQVREPGMKRWEFLAGGGQLTASPVHAAVTPRAVARKVASMIEARYPDTRARAVRSGAGRIRSRPVRRDR
jgi:hypothetical protein